MAFNTGANWRVINLSGTQKADELGNGVSATTVHEIYCLSSGSIEITAAGGGTFTWTASANDNIQVVPKRTKVNSGSFIGFKAKHFPAPSGPLSKGSSIVP